MRILIANKQTCPSDVNDNRNWAGNDGGTVCHKSLIHKVYIVREKGPPGGIFSTDFCHQGVPEWEKSEK